MNMQADLTPYLVPMKNTLALSVGTIAFVLSLFFACAAPPPSAQDKFEANAATVAQVFADFEAESDAFFTHFAPDAVWQGTGLDAPETVTLEQVRKKYQGAWSKYDYELISEVDFLPSVDPVSKELDGTVCGYFEWNISKPATDSTDMKSVRIRVYESFRFNEAGEIVYTQVYGNLVAGYQFLDR